MGDRAGGDNQQGGAEREGKEGEKGECALVLIGGIFP